MRRLYLFVGGFFFATLQFSYYLSLEWRLSSAWTTYALLTLGWMAGILAGLRLSRGIKDEALLALNLAGYGLVWLLASRCPFDDRLLPVYALCVLSSGAYAGFFFRSNYDRLKDARALLLHENNGFVLGLLVGFLGFYLCGWRFTLWLPAAAALLLPVIKRLAF
ncbi:MAG: hypothetical protein HY922_17530 [Elusimicrobia bacterium]|nr:hypothetical protein [Elusimicrobiota bacterium]